MIKQIISAVITRHKKVLIPLVILTIAIRLLSDGSNLEVLTNSFALICVYWMGLSIFLTAAMTYKLEKYKQFLEDIQGKMKDQVEILDADEFLDRLKKGEYNSDKAKDEEETKDE